MRVLFLPARVGQASLPGAFWCASPFSWPLSLSALLGPLRAGIVPSFFFVCLLSSLCWFFFVRCSLCGPALSLAFSGFWLRVAWALAICVSFPFPPSCLFCFRCAPPLSLAFPAFRPQVPWALVLCGPHPRSALWVFFFFFSLFFLLRCFSPPAPPSAFPLPPAFFPGLLCPPHSSCLFFWSPAARLSVCSRCFVFCAWPLAAPLWLLPHPPVLCPAVFVAAARCSVFCFSSSAALLPPDCFALVGSSRGLLPPPPPLVCCVALPLLGSACAIAAFVFPAWPLAAPFWLLPPPPFLSRVFFCRCRSMPRFLVLSCFARAFLLGGRRRFSPSATPPPPRVRAWCLVLSGVAALRCPSVGCFAVPCCRVPCCVSCCGALPCCVVGCCPLCGGCWGVRLCVVLCCWLLLRVVPCLWSCRPIGL